MSGDHPEGRILGDTCSGNPALRCQYGDSEGRFADTHHCVCHMGLSLQSEKRPGLYTRCCSLPGSYFVNILHFAL